MNKSGYVGAAALLQLAACSNQAAAPARDAAEPPAQAEANQTAAARQEERRLILAFGDSLYAGYRLRQNEGFAPALERALAARGVEAKVVNAGVSGDTTAGGLRRLAFTLEGLERKPDLAIVGLGANDMLRGFPPAETRRNLDGILAELKRRGIPVMLTGMVAPNNYGSDYVRQFGTIYTDLAAKYDAPLDPFFLQDVITDPKLLLDDRLHPNAQGVQRMAQRVAPMAAEAVQDAGI